MKQNISKIFLFLTIFLLLNCGFKTLEKSQINSFTVNDIITTGDKRVNYKIKNILLANSTNDSQNILSINLSSDKNKVVKEKNIKNEIIKYQITLNVTLEFKKLKKENKVKTILSATGDYNVAKNNSTTLNFEKKLIENLAENISNRILDAINLKLNDI